MKPRQFCRLWLNATEDEEQSRGYRTQCVKLLSRIIGVEENTIERWGSGIDFPGMPAQYENTLSYALTIKRMLEEGGKAQRDIFLEVLKQLEDS
ncbi:MAG: hypothetical protein KME07_03430 [Pegethrix bostrychoides GSE-TBD4-15B]|uniref:Uncharacterized protein n=1 Tax=Pegethrix bostrychoides GSE-TBD4-15B TaxID=2839662 RepID=A0A951U4I0_9CYAN|nr:hypothetical protein [Pegethrix bostrychoides GSE-TBD4-15B]